jgi:hypothetical protein
MNIKDGVTGGCRKLHKGQFHNFYPSQSVIRIIKSRRTSWAGHVARMRKKRNTYRIVVGKPTGMRPLRRHRRRWEDTIKMDLRERERMEWSGLD